MSNEGTQLRLPLPAFFAVPKNSVELQPGGIVKRIDNSYITALADDAHESMAVALFSRGDLAEKFAAEHGQAGKVAVLEISSREQFERFLRSLPPELDHFVIDPRRGPCPAMPVKLALEQMRSSSSRPS